MNEGGRGQSGNGRIFGNEVDEANQAVRNADHPARPRKNILLLLTLIGFD
jgi:hypothetical protein